MAATIRDVAKLANVSVATVSRVINESGSVNDKTKQKVLEAIRELDYQPNDVARSLFKGKSKMIALFVPDIMNPFFPELARAVEDITNQHGYTFVLCNTDNDHQKELKYLNALLQKSIDGFIIVSSTMETNHINKLRVPIISLDRKTSSDLISVTVNNREGARQAVKHLKDLGCERIMYIAGPEDVSSARNRMLGYLDIVKEEEWFTEDYILEGNYSMDDAYEVTRNMLMRNPNIDGIFAANDLMGVGALQAAASLNIDVPDKLSVISFDGIKLGETTSPALTTMAQPIYKIGKRAAELLINKIEKPTEVIESEEHDVQLVVRESTQKGS